MKKTKSFEYLPADKWCVINEEDPALHPVWIRLPDPPPLKRIDGYGLPPHEQKFVRQVMPQKLADLEAQLDTIDEIWQEITDNVSEYQDEIKWIKKQWHRRFNGYWFFLNGKPTYINGWNYVYLNTWKFMDGGLPDYRDRHRRYFHGMKYSYTCTEAPVVDENGHLKYFDPELRIPEMRDFGTRLMFGITYPKNRRDGATNMSLCAQYCETTIRAGVISGIISMDGESAKDHFAEILVPGWQGMWFFFKPNYDGFDNPEEQIKFFAPKKKNQRTNKKQLRSKLNYSKTAQSTGYDRSKIFWMLCDEGGKTVEANVDSRHQILKNCVSQGNGSVIGGFMTYPSTVGEMKGKGGQNYFNLCQKSHWEKRNKIGQTTSGLMNIFFKSEEGLEGFVDPFGNSVITAPTEEQIEIAKREKNWQDKYKYAVLDMGARQYLEERRNSFLAADDMEGYNEEVRLFPQSYAEAFRTEDEDVGFNLKILNERIDELKFMQGQILRGNFEWENDVQDSRVVFKVCEDGRWRVSKRLKESEANKRYKDGDHWWPFQTKFTASADPFRQNKTKGSGKRISDGGGAVFWDFDPAIDGGEKDIKHWQSHRLVCTYRNRPMDRDMYCEDMLMMSVYYGAMMYPEINVTAVWDWFMSRGYGGYLKYDWDPKTNDLSKTPGFNSQDKSKQELFNSARDYIENHGHRCMHMDYLMECKEIPGIEYMTKFDLFTAGSGAILGSKSRHSKLIEIHQQKVDVSSYHETYEYN